MAQSALVVEADRAREFNPVKNQSGADSPETSRAAICRINREWLQAAGYQVADDARTEISPLLDTQSLQGLIPPGETISDGTVL